MTDTPAHYPRITVSKINRGRETVAHVNAHDPLSAADILALYYIAEQCSDLYPNDSRGVVVSEEQFLKENQIYDVVFVHRANLATVIFPWHWCYRLSQCGARMIVIMADNLPPLVKPEDIAPVRGYKLFRKVEHANIYVREEHGSPDK